MKRIQIQKRIIPLMLAWGIMVCLTGCQASPDEDIVINKSESDMAAAIADTDVNDAEASDVPSSYEDTFVCSGEDIQVEVTAQVTVLGDAFPVVKVTPHTITSEEAQHWADVLFEGATAYEPQNQYSKADLEDRILTLRSLCDLDALTETYGSSEAAQSMLTFYEQQIAEYEAMYADAPEQLERALCDWQFHPSDYYDADAVMWEGNEEYESLKDTYLIEAVGYDAGTYIPRLSVSNREADDYRLNRISFQSLSDEVVPGDRSDISYEEAASMAADTLEQLGLENWMLWESYTNASDEALVYIFMYSPGYSGTPTLMGRDLDLTSDDSYAANYAYSSLQITINNGRVAVVELNSPTDVVEVQNENVQTLPFEEVYERFKTQIQDKYTIDDFVEFGGPDAQMEHEITIQVTSIREGLFRIREKNAEYSFLMVPAWLFTGEVFIDGASWGQTDLCYINAIDGSVIDPSLGY